MNRSALFASIVALCAVAAQSVQEIGDPRWRALAALVGMIVVWIVGLHTEPPAPAGTAPAKPQETAAIVVNGAIPEGALGDLVLEVRSYRSEVRTLTDHVQRALSLQTRDHADHQTFLRRLEALERGERPNDEHANEPTS